MPATNPISWSVCTAMAVTCHLLILLIPVLSLCGASEYYVRPTEPTNTSCPAQPCLTLSQYINDPDHYFQSNTAFKFLPGTHHMDRPLIIGNVQNITLEASNKRGEHPELLAEFTCGHHHCIHAKWQNVCCAAVFLHDIHNVTLMGIRVTVQTANATGVILKKATGSSVQLTTVHCLNSRSGHGIVIYEANLVKVQSFTVNNCSDGLMLDNTSNIQITNTTAKHNMQGIVLHTTSYTNITKTTANHNRYNGMHLKKINNTHIISTIANHNHFSGIHLEMTCNTYLKDSYVSNNYVGIYSVTADNTHLTNVIATRDKMGISLSNANNSHIINTAVTHNWYCGIDLYHTSNTCITNTSATYNQGGGICAFHLNNTYMKNIIATQNGRRGIFLHSTHNSHITETSTTNNQGQGISLHHTNNTHITSINARQNGFTGWYYELFSVVKGQVAMHYAVHTHIHNSSFTHINTSHTASSTVPESLPAVLSLYQSTLHMSGCNFSRNQISSLKAIESNITTSGNVIFSSNKAIAGTAFILVQNSILSVAESSHIHFINNYAINTGGVFYISTNVNYVEETAPKTTCFLRTWGSRFRERLIFLNNSAGMGGDILYGGQVALGMDGDWNCLESFKNLSSISRQGLSLISSEPSHVCLCSETGQPECSTHNSTLRTAYPGQTINISAVVVGQDYGTVAGSVYAQFVQFPTQSSPWLGQSQSIQSVTQHTCNYLYYTIFFSSSEVSETVLGLTPHKNLVSSFISSEEPKETGLPWESYYFHKFAYRYYYMHHNYPLHINITLLPCPLGFMLTSYPPFRCDCNPLLRQIHGVKCYIQGQTIYHSGSVWVGMDKGMRDNVAASEHCPLNYCRKEGCNVTLNESDSQCKYNHSGILCGGCQPGLSLALGGGQCLKCSNKYLALLIPIALAGPVLVSFIKLLDLTVSQGAMHGLIFYANIIKVSEHVLLPQEQTSPMTIFIAWLNLDMGVETCFFQGLSAYSKTWLQFAFPLYVWVITGLLLISTRYCRTLKRIMGENSLSVAATMILLTYTKILRIIATALSYTILHTSQGHRAVWSADGNVDYLGPKHAPLFAVAVATLLFLLLPYTLLLLLEQWLQSCKSRLISLTMMKIRPFLDVHYSSLRDNRHSWFGTLLVVRAALFLTSALLPANHASVVVICIFASATALMFFGRMNYRIIAVEVYDISFFANLALLAGTNLHTIRAREKPAVADYIFIGIAFIQFVGLIIFKVVSIFRNNRKVIACLGKGRHVAGGQLEVNEEKGVLTKMELDTANQEGSESNKCAPT